MSTLQSDDRNEQPGEPNRSEELAHGFRLRADHPRVTRLSRKVLAGGTAVALVLVGGAVLWALQNNRSRGPAPDELYSTDHHNVADGLAGLPRDYAGVPRQVPSLGPPLPGDLGRQILAAQGQPPTTTATGFDQEQQRRDQEIEAARVSRLFASTNIRETTPAAAQVSSVDRAASSAMPGTDDGFAQNGQDRKLAFVNASVDRRTTSPDRVTKPASPYAGRDGDPRRSHHRDQIGSPGADHGAGDRECF
jgi:type IV secretion system protein VirB10